MPPKDIEEQEEEQQEEEISLRDELESAIEEEETDETEETPEEETETEESSVEEPDSESEEPEPESEEEPEPTDAIGDGEGTKEPSDINAPIGYSAEARELWNDVPEMVKEEIQKREQEITEAMANTGEFRRTHQHLSELAQSYAPILAAEGAETPMKAIEGLFQTVAELRVGSPQQIATKMAQLINHYGVDIQMLDGALAGEAPDPEVSKFQQMLDSRLAPIQEALTGYQSMSASQEEAAKSAVQQELDEFAKDAEFLADVREDMADLIDMASKRDKKMGFREAYDKACAMHPSVSKVLAARAETERLKNSGQKIAAKSNASSSIASNSGQSSAATGDVSLRDGIANLWDAATE